MIKYTKDTYMRFLLNFTSAAILRATAAFDSTSASVVFGTS